MAAKISRFDIHDELTAPAESAPILKGALSGSGKLNNFVGVLAGSPAALRGYARMRSELRRGTLPGATQERIALAVAEANGCTYCLSAHTYLGKHVAKLDDAELDANRAGTSNDPKAAAAVRFAVKVVHERGHVQESDVRALKAAGYDDAQVVEIVQHVALNTWTNYINELAKTDVDFPVVAPREHLKRA